MDPSFDSVWMNFNEERQKNLFEKYTGFHRAVVVETNDPLRIGRVRFIMPEMHDESYRDTPELCPWALPAPALGGYGAGTWVSPIIGDIIWVTFEKNHAYGPIYVGAADPTRRKRYPLPSVSGKTPLAVTDDGKPADKPKDFDDLYHPLDNRPMSYGFHDRYGHTDIFSAVGYVPEEHSKKPAIVGTDALAEADYDVSDKAPKANDPDVKYAARITKYGTYTIHSDVGYEWDSEFEGSFVNDEQFEADRWKYFLRLLNEEAPSGRDQRRWETRTRYGHKIELRDVGWAKTRAGEYSSEAKEISGNKDRDERWIKLRTKGGHIFQMIDSGSDQAQDNYIKRLPTTEIGASSEEEDKLGRDARIIRLQTRYGFKMIFDDRGSDSTDADGKEEPRGNGWFVKGRREDRGFFMGFNEKDAYNNLILATPKGNAIEMSDKQGYVGMSTSTATPLTEAREGHYGVEWPSHSLRSTDFEANTYHMVLDRTNKFMRGKTPTGQGWEFRDRCVQPDNKKCADAKKAEKDAEKKVEDVRKKAIDKLKSMGVSNAATITEKGVSKLPPEQQAAAKEEAKKLDDAKKERDEAKAKRVAECGDPKKKQAADDAQNQANDAKKAADEKYQNAVDKLKTAREEAKKTRDLKRTPDGKIKPGYKKDPAFKEQKAKFDKTAQEYYKARAENRKANQDYQNAQKKADTAKKSYEDDECPTECRGWAEVRDEDDRGIWMNATDGYSVYRSKDARQYLVFHDGEDYVLIKNVPEEAEEKARAEGKEIPVKTAAETKNKGKIQIIASGNVEIISGKTISLQGENITLKAEKEILFQAADNQAILDQYLLGTRKIFSCSVMQGRHRDIEKPAHPAGSAPPEPRGKVVPPITLEDLVDVEEKSPVPDIPQSKQEIEDNKKKCEEATKAAQEEAEKAEQVRKDAIERLTAMGIPNAATISEKGLKKLPPEQQAAVREEVKKLEEARKERDKAEAKQQSICGDAAFPRPTQDRGCAPNKKYARRVPKSAAGGGGGAGGNASPKSNAPASTATPPEPSPNAPDPNEPAVEPPTSSGDDSPIPIIDPPDPFEPLPPDPLPNGCLWYGTSDVFLDEIKADGLNIESFANNENVPPDEDPKPGQFSYTEVGTDIPEEPSQFVFTTDLEMARGDKFAKLAQKRHGGKALILRITNVDEPENLIFIEDKLVQYTGEVIQPEQIEVYEIGREVIEP